MSEWQPIETAPKGVDADDVLCWYPARGGYCEVSWYEDGEWTCFVNLEFEHNDQPTHWIPIPSPPPNTKK